MCVGERMEERKGNTNREDKLNGGAQLYLVLFPFFLHLTDSSVRGCWENGLSNI